MAASGRVSAQLTKTGFTAAEATTVKLVCKFSPASTRWSYVLSLKKGAKWVTVRSVKKTGSFKGSYAMTVKRLFASKAVKIGHPSKELVVCLNRFPTSVSASASRTPGGSGRTMPAEQIPASYC